MADNHWVMKTQRCLALCMAALLLAQLARGADSDVHITVEKKRMNAGEGEVHKPANYTTKRTETWGFTVTVDNQTFKPLENLEAKYIIFYRHEQLGIKGPPRKETKSGSSTITSIDSLGTASFDTDGVTLTRAALIGDPGSYEYFANGAKPTAEDTITGIWVRLYKDGNQFAEYAYPTGLTSSETWQ
jgi:hypothetical protein